MTKNSGNYADRTANVLLQDVIPDYDDGYIASAPVGKFPPNNLGLYDVGGNVAEWIHDYYAVSADASKAAVDPLGPSNPLRTTVEQAGGAWLDNYRVHPWMMLLPVLGFAGAALALIGIRTGKEALAFSGSSLSVTGIIATVGCSMFPFILPSSIDPHSSLTVWNASSTARTLGIMLVVTLVFLPIVLAYTAWAYKVMFGRVTADAVRTNPDYY